MRRLKANNIETTKVDSQIGQDGKIFPSSPCFRFSFFFFPFSPTSLKLRAEKIFETFFIFPCFFEKYLKTLMKMAQLKNEVGNALSNAIGSSSSSPPLLTTTPCIHNKSVQLPCNSN